MKLEQLMEDVPFTLVQGTLETEIEDIIYDSRKAAPGRSAWNKFASNKKYRCVV